MPGSRVAGPGFALTGVGPALIDRLLAGAALGRAVLAPLERPDRVPRALAALAPWGPSVAGLVAAAAARYPDRIAVHDDAGAITYRALWQRARAIASGLQDRSIGPGSRVGLLARNHRGFVEALAACSAVGADVVLLNPGFAGPQLAEVVADEGIDALVHDGDLSRIAGAAHAPLAIDETEVSALAGSGTTVSPTRHQASIVILTSGTTGRPKGAARRSGASSAAGIAALLDRIPLRLGDTQVVAAPLFHAWGLSHLLLGLARCATTVLERRFDPERTIRSVAEHDAGVLVVVPVMLARILALPDEILDRITTPSLRVIASSGSALGGTLATAVLDRFGPVLYNLYGSTEVAVATIADPADLRAAPATAGRVPHGVRVEILDEHGAPVPDGAVGRIFVGGAMRFDGYTGGGDKERIRGLVSSGDRGVFRDGLLFVEGRDDDMIVSGGENVFPGEVEELLVAHPAIADAAVAGVPDDDFGQVLSAFVVKAPTARLTKAEVRRYVRDHLARHKVPRHVTFVDELPRTTTGKLVRRSLVEPG